MSIAIPNCNSLLQLDEDDGHSIKPSKINDSVDKGSKLCKDLNKG